MLLGTGIGVSASESQKNSRALGHPPDSAAAAEGRPTRPPGRRRLTAKGIRQKLADVGDSGSTTSHTSNLAGVLSRGALLADPARRGRPTGRRHLLRRPRSAPRHPRVRSGSLSVAKYVPFFLSPDASVWDGIRAQSDDPRLALDAGASVPFDFVILVSTVRKALDAQAGSESTDAADAAEDESGSVAASVVATDGDATGALTRFGARREDAERVLRTLRADPSLRRSSGRFLVEGPSLRAGDAIGLNDKVREAAAHPRGVVALAQGRRAPAVVQPPEESAE
jgi:hypothetical protein